MTTLALILVLVIVVEALIEYFGSPLPSTYKPYVAAVLGMLLCLAYGADLLALLGYPASVPLVGSILTGLLISRGSNVFNDLVSRLNRTSELLPIQIGEAVQVPATPVDPLVRERLVQ